MKISLAYSTIMRTGMVKEDGMPVTVRRNAYGRQLGSFQTAGDMKGIGQFPMTFIRAPYIEEVCGDVEILSVIGGKIVAARYGSQLGLVHPELTGNAEIHRYSP